MNKQDLRLLKQILSNGENDVVVTPENKQSVKRLQSGGCVLLLGRNADGEVGAFGTAEGEQLLEELSKRRAERVNNVQKWITASAAVVAALAAVVGVVLQIVLR